MIAVQQSMVLTLPDGLNACMQGTDKAFNSHTDLISARTA